MGCLSQRHTRVLNVHRARIIGAWDRRSEISAEETEQANSDVRVCE